MRSRSRRTPAGMPCTMIVSCGPCDSPADVKVKRDIARSGRRELALAAEGQVRAHDHEQHGDELRDCERSEETIVLGADDLDEETLDAEEDEEHAPAAALWMRAFVHP